MDPSRNMGKAQAADGGQMEEGGGAREFKMGRMDVKVPPLDYLQDTLAKIKPWSVMKSKVEKDYPGWTIPGQADLEALGFGEENKENKLKRMGEEGLNLPDGQVSIFTMDDDEPNRHQFLVSGGSYTEQPLSSGHETDTKTTLEERDFAGFFLVKKSQVAEMPPESMKTAA